jgi:hypothetical protein
MRALVALAAVAVALVTTTSASCAPVPAGFDPVSFTAVSENDYWVLGSVPCLSGRCNSILRTRDGGGHFVGLRPPRLASGAAGVPPTLRFADRRDGFAFVTGVGGAFYATHDGGTTWHRIVLGDVLAFATGGGKAYAVTARCTLQRCTGYRLVRSPVSADTWTGTALPFRPDGPIVDLAAHGTSVWLLGTPAGRQRSRRDELARSTDGGRTFVTGPGPCYPGLGGELAPTSGNAVWAMCPTGMLAQAWRSTDAGVSFTRLNTPPLANSAVVAPASRDSAVLARDGAGARLLRTTDGGTVWKSPRTPRRAKPFLWIGFTDARVGAALVQGGYDASAKVAIQALWRTTDGGATWSIVRFG